MGEHIVIKPKKILVIKLRKLGDVLSTTPAVRQLRELYPDSEITFLTEPLGSKIYEYSTKIDHLWILSRKPTLKEYLTMCFKVLRGNFDLVIDLYFHNKTALISLFSMAGYRFGFSKNDKRTMAYTNVVQLSENDFTKVYCSNHQLKLIKPLGTNYADNKVEFEIDSSVQEKALGFVNRNKIDEKTIAFCVLSERSFAQVPIDFLIKIGNYLVEKGYSLYFVYGPNEKDLAMKVHGHIDQKKACIIDYEVPTVAEQRGIFEHCCLFVGNDGGNKHIATASNISTIGLFYNENPLVWTPEDRSKHQFLQIKENAFEEFEALFSKWSFEERRFIE